MNDIALPQPKHVPRSKWRIYAFSCAHQIEKKTYERKTISLIFARAWIKCLILCSVLLRFFFCARRLPRSFFRQWNIFSSTTHTFSAIRKHDYELTATFLSMSVWVCVYVSHTYSLLQMHTLQFVSSCVCFLFCRIRLPYPLVVIALNAIFQTLATTSSTTYTLPNTSWFSW